MYYIHQSFYSRLFGSGIVLILSLAQIIAKATFLKKKCMVVCTCYKQMFSRSFQLENESFVLKDLNCI